MECPEVKIQLLPNFESEWKPEFYKTAGAAGMDLYAAIDRMRRIPPASNSVEIKNPIPCGIKLAIPRGWCGVISARSGTAKNRMLVPINAPGIIDSDYRGEIMVLLSNLGMFAQEVSPGERIAQILIMPAPQAKLIFVSSLDETVRGEGGFGSTGN